MRVLLISALLCVPSVVLANSGNVGGSTVRKGVHSLEARVAVEFDADEGTDRGMDTRIHYDYAFTDSYAFRIVATQVRPANDNYEHSDMRMEHRFQLLDQSQDWLDASVRFEYIWEDGANGADQGRIRLTGAKQVDDWYFRTNLFLRHDVGEEAEDGLGTELRWQAMKKISVTKWGIEGFNNFGNLNTTEGWETQSHQVGLVVKGRLTEGLGYQTGYLAGLSRAAPDHAVKLFITQKF